MDKTAFEYLRTNRWFPFLIILFVIIRYHSIVGNFFLCDDPQHIKFVISHQPWEYFFVPDAWHQLSAGLLTPWLSLSYYTDWKLFSLDPRGYYLHHLFIVCMTAVAGYAVLRLWFTRSLSLISMMLFIASPPFAETTYFLMERHYVEGLLFALLAVYFYTKGIRFNRRSLSLVGAVMYLLSCSAKEIYVPLPLIVLFLPESAWNNRLRHLLPWFGCTLIYAIWRRLMLGQLFGGYGHEIQWISDMVVFFPRMVDAMGGVTGKRVVLWRFAVCFSTFMACTVLYVRNKEGIFRAIALLPFLVSPIIPVSQIMSPRYVWLIIYFWIIFHIVAWKEMCRGRRKRLAFGVILGWAILLLLSFTFLSPHQAMVKETSLLQGLEGRFILYEGSSTDLLISPNAPGWYCAGLRWLREHILHSTEGPQVAFDTNIVCLDILSPLPDTSAMSKYTGICRLDSVKGIISRQDIRSFCAVRRSADIRMKEPLSLDIRYSALTADWKFGPYEKGEYTVLFGDTGEEAQSLPPTGKRFVSWKGQSFPLRLRYSSPDGWMTYSPLMALEVDESGNGSIKWQRY
jgi:hypothetical protein